jgi:hypothetical protein
LTEKLGSSCNEITPVKSERVSGRRRRFGLVVLAVGVLLSVAGVVLLGEAGVLEVIAIAALAYGIGLLVSGVFLAAGWRPGGHR